MLTNFLKEETIWLFKLMIYFIFLYYYSFTQEGSSGTKLENVTLILDNHIVVVMIVGLVRGLVRD